MASAANILQRQFKGTILALFLTVGEKSVLILSLELIRSPVPGFVVDLKDDNIFEW